MIRLEALQAAPEKSSPFVSQTLSSHIISRSRSNNAFEKKNKVAAMEGARFHNLQSINQDAQREKDGLYRGTTLC